MQRLGFSLTRSKRIREAEFPEKLELSLKFDLGPARDHPLEFFDLRNKLSNM